MNTVYVFAPSDGRFNTEGAVAFGCVKHTALPDGRSFFNTDAIMEWLAEALAEFDPDTDFVAMTGQNVVIALAVSYVLSNFGRVRLLLFDARTSKYVERTVHHPRFVAEEAS